MFSCFTPYHFPMQQSHYPPVLFTFCRVLFLLLVLATCGTIQSYAQTTHLPIQHHIVRKSDGSGGLGVDDVNNVINDLNFYYDNPTSAVHFYQCGPISYIDDNLIYNFQRSQTSVLAAQHDVPNVINIYYCKTVDGSAGAAFASFPGGADRIMISNIPATNGTTIVHEMGHFYSLLHPHTFGELVGDPNEECEFVGDKVCDTQASPKLGPHNVTNCAYTGSEEDILGTPYQPDVDNIMSYTPSNCANTLTTQQLERFAHSVRFDRPNISCGCNNANFAAPIAEFSGNSNACPGQLVQFNDISANCATSWQWTFQDGTPPTSIAKNPLVSFATEGQKTITLVSTNSSGSSTMLTKVMGINIQDISPQAANCVPAPATLGTIGAISNLTFRQIDHDSGDPQTEGIYQDFSCTAPVAMLAPSSTYDISITTGANTMFRVFIDYNNDGVFDPVEEAAYSDISGALSTYHNGVIQTPANPVLGQHVRMRIVSEHFSGDMLGFTASSDPCFEPTAGQVEDYNVLFGALPETAFTADNSSICVGEQLQFTDQSTGNALSWQWSFPGANPATSTDAAPLVSYPEAGIYPVSLSVSNAFGNGPVSTSTLSVNGPAVSGEVSPLLCSGTDNASIAITITGGTAPFTTEWLDGPTTEDRSGLAAGDYVFTLVDASGCQIQQAYEVLPFPVGLSYCEPQTTAPTANGHGIFEVDIKDLNSKSGSAAAEGYRDFGCTVPPAPVAAGNYYYLTITTGSTYPENVKAYLDANNNGSFADPGELLMTSDNQLELHNASVLIPASAALNASLKLRIISDTTSNTITDACYAPETGQVEDYNLIIATIPEPAFAVQQQAICSGSAIEFMDESTNQPAVWNWTFPGGTPATSTAQNPVVTYDTPGIYAVSLQVSNNAGGSSTLTETAFITVRDHPKASGEQTNLLCPGVAEGAIDLNITGGTAPYDLQWSSGQIHASVFDLAEGTYGVTVSDLFGCSSTQSFDITTPDLFYTESPGENALIACAGTAFSFQVNPAITCASDLQWAFPGGSPPTSIDPNPLVTYSTPGYRDVSLTITNSAGQDITQTKEDLVLIPTPAKAACVSNTLDLPASSGRGILHVALKDLAHSSGSAASDGGYVDNTCVLPPVRLASSGDYLLSVTTGLTHAENVHVYIDYSNSGTFEPGELVFSSLNAHSHSAVIKMPSLTSGISFNRLLRMRVISDDAGATITGGCYAPQYGQVEDYLVFIGSTPTSDFSADATAICQHGSAQFTDQSEGITLYRYWSFEGGIPATSKAINPLVEYNQPGTYDVVFTVENTRGETETKVLTDYITVSESPALELSTSDPTCHGAPGGAIALSIDGTQSPYVPAWSNGESTQSLSNISGGIYTVTVTGTNNCASSATALVQEPEPADGPPKAFIWSDQRIVCAGTSLEFQDFSTNCPYAWFWSFEGGTPSTSTDQHPVIAYHQPGVYEVSLVATNSDGASNPTVQKAYITVGAQSVAEPFCMPQETGAFQAIGAGIFNVHLESLNNTSVGQVSEGNYANYACALDPVALVAGNQYTIDVTTGLSVDENVGAFIDYNNDGDFDDAGEYVGHSQKHKTHAITFTVPAGTSINVPLRMRLISNLFYKGILNDPCETSSHGQTEDYTVIVAVPTALPSVDFTAAVTNVCIGEPVQLLDFSTQFPTQWLWDLPGASTITSTEKNPVVTYTTPGYKSVTLTATNIVGSTGPVSKPALIHVLESPATTCVPETEIENTMQQFGVEYGIVHVALNTIDHLSQGSSLDGGYLDLSCTEKTQLLPGEDYELTLSTIFDTEDLRVWIDFNGDGDLTDPGEEIVNYNWFPTPFVQPFGTQTITMPTNPALGQPLRMRVTSDESINFISGPCYNPERGQAQDYSVFFPDQPVANFSSDATTLCAGAANSFSDESTGIPTSWAWSFPDAVPPSSADQNPTNIVFPTAGGPYPVTLTVTNGAGSDTKTITSYITVTANSAPAITAVVTPETCTGAQNGSIDITITGGQQPYDILWSTSAVTEDISQLPVGQYRVEITDLNSCVSSPEFLVQGAAQDMSITLENSAPTTCNGGSDGALEFDIFGGGGNFTYDWSSNQSGIDPGLAAGFYDVTITDQFGCSKTLTNLEVMEPAAADTPTSDFEIAPAWICAGGSMEFTDLSNACPTDWDWAFPTGTPTTSINQNPTVNFSTPGIHIATLVATNGNGAGTSVTKQFAVALSSSDYCPIDPSVPVTVPPASEYGVGNVTFSNINHTTAGASDGKYVDYSCQQIAVVEAGKTYDIDVTTVSQVDENWVSVYIDFNNDGEFIVDERILFSHKELVNHHGTVTIPTSASAGLPLRMRVTSDRWQAVGNSCSNPIRGQVEDYMVYIDPGSNAQALFEADVTEVCPGEPVNFINQSFGQTKVVLWSFEGGTPATSTEFAPQNITWSTAGTYDVTLTVENAFGQSVLLEEELITVAPGIIHNTVVTNATCGLDNGVIDITLVPGSPPVTYNWSNATAAQDVNNLAAGNYQVTMTTPNGCTAMHGWNVDAVNGVEVLEHPVDASVCEGSTAAFSALAEGGNDVQYQWQHQFSRFGWTSISRFDPAFDNVDSPTLSVNNTPSYLNGRLLRARITNECGEVVYTDPAVLHVQFAPHISSGPNDQTACPDDEAVFSLIMHGDELAFIWQVNKGSGFVDIDNEPNISGEATHELTVMAQPGMDNWSFQCLISGACDPSTISGIGTLTVLDPITCNPGNKTQQRAGLKHSSITLFDALIYPNPVSHDATLAVELSEAGNLNIQVFNTLGQLVLPRATVAKQAGRHTIPLPASQLVSGTYIIRLMHNNQFVVKRFVVQ